ncbi:MAG: putative tricarboxylic transport rane protein [Nocardioidaceae bacterium]|jgi:putative tricarboxylic transport membrane protein|nr:putative tricarboxylic transport rane protein [Nocardioidaceae bacterium]
MTTTHQPPTPPRESRVVDKAQYALAAGIGIAGAYVIYDATTLHKGFSDQPVQPYAFPYVVGAALVVLSVLLAFATARGDVAESEEGEDVDLAKGSDWVTVGKLVAVFTLNFVLISWLGWAITGALLFAGTAHVLGARSFVRSLAIGVVLSVGTWYGFYSGLGLAIPAGILDGVL